jgi:hypothetical protein
MPKEWIDPGTPRRRPKQPKPKKSSGGGGGTTVGMAFLVLAMGVSLLAVPVGVIAYRIFA